MSAAVVSIHTRVYSNSLTHTHTYIHTFMLPCSESHSYKGLGSDSALEYILLLLLLQLQLLFYKPVYFVSIDVVVTFVIVIMLATAVNVVAKSFMNADDYNDNCDVDEGDESSGVADERSLYS